MCVPWELNLQPFALLTQCSTTEPQEDLHTLHTGTHTLNISFTYLMSSSWAKMMTPRALGVSISLLMILSNSPGLGSRGIFMDWAMHRPPLSQREREMDTNAEFFLFILMTAMNFWQQMGTNACSCLCHAPLWNFLKYSILMESPIWIILYASVCFTSIDYQRAESKPWWPYGYCTCLSRDLNEGVYSTFTIVPLRR